MEIDGLQQQGTEAILRCLPDTVEGGFFSGFGTDRMVGRMALIGGIPVEEANRINDFAKGIGKTENALSKFITISGQQLRHHRLVNGVTAQIVDGPYPWVEVSDTLHEFYEFGAVQIK